LATPALEFDTDDATLRTAYRAALACLEQNTVTLAGFPDPVLIEGSVYRGVWLECAPQEGLVYPEFVN
jgi:hypothetical protein